MECVELLKSELKKKAKLRIETRYASEKSR
jgi:hypothetical protein